VGSLFPHLLLLLLWKNSEVNRVKGHLTMWGYLVAIKWGTLFSDFPSYALFLWSTVFNHAYKFSDHVCEISCSDGACIRRKFVCDGHQDCLGGLDEEDCSMYLHFCIICNIMDTMKTAKIKPLFKKWDKQDIQNYRPTSILCVFENSGKINVTYYSF
jgi:hypothetical protein